MAVSLKVAGFCRSGWRCLQENIGTEDMSRCSVCFLDGNCRLGGWLCKPQFPFGNRLLALADCVRQRLLATGNADESKYFWIH